MLTLTLLLSGTPVYSHSDDVIAVAESGKHVLCEKPMARTVTECDQIIQVCQQNGIILMVAFMKHYNKCFLQAKQMIENGDLGCVFQVRVDWSFLSHPGGWRDSLPTWGGIYQDHGSHAIDLCRWWLGE
ncbi:TPA: Gfo/Idh/MocA family oxidoreductase, partial [Candidatus Poribacteria bacterium]|nr:Gfo/Idh/MocA family oxidoreductase [Candidatus Poribacteria bacterium]